MGVVGVLLVVGGSWRLVAVGSCLFVCWSRFRFVVVIVMMAVLVVNALVAVAVACGVDVAVVVGCSGCGWLLRLVAVSG